MPESLVFNHIPKSAGTSLRIALARSLDVPKAVDGFDRSLFGGFDDFGSCAPEFRAVVAMSPEDLPEAPQLVVGHYALSTTKARYPAARHMTVLREARSRLLSHWMFWRAHRDEQLTSLGSWAGYVRKGAAPLVDFLEDPTIAASVDNVALRLLLWPHHAIPVDGHIDPRDDDALLAEALAKLEQMDFVGIVEDPDFEPSLSAWLGSPLKMERLNETMPIPEERRTSLWRQLTPAAIDALVKRSRLDDALWMHVAERRMSRGRAECLREAARAQSLARHAILMAA